MQEILEIFFSPYKQYSFFNIFLESTGIIFGFLSVWFSKRNNILVYPTGMISTSIFVYLLYSWGLIGDMLINGYYFIISIYGWFYWSQSKNGKTLNKISIMNKCDKIIIIILFVFAIIFVLYIYTLFGKLNSIIAIVDTITTAIFFSGMWLMAKRKIENWIFWIIGDIVSIPLYFYKGLVLTSFQYLVFTLIAIAGYYSWKKEILHEKK